MTTTATTTESGKSVCFTLNNWTRDEYDIILNKWPKIASYFVVGKEICPTTGTPHLQGYVEWNSSKKWTTMHKIFKGRARWTERYKDSTPKQAADYCKKDGDFIEHGEISNPQQGARTDIRALMECISDGMSEIEVFERHPECAMKYIKGMDRYRLLCQKRNAKGYNKKNVRVYWGETGTGKTRSAIEEFPDAFIVTAGITGLWWDGYDGEECVVIDEFRGNNCPLSMLLTILDGYATQVSIRGGSRILNAKTIIITSNIAPENWYEGADDESRKALLRRIDTTKKFQRPKSPGNTRPVTSATEWFEKM